MTAPRPGSVTGLAGVGVGSLAVALGAGPVAWTVHLVASVALVPYACDTGREWPLHVITAATVLATLIGLRAALHLRRAGRAGDAAAPAEQRAAFLSTVAIYLGLLFLGLIVLEGIPVAVLDACE